MALDWTHEGDFAVGRDQFGFEVTRHRVFSCALCGLVERGQKPIKGVITSLEPIPSRWVYLKSSNGELNGKMVACAMCSRDAKRDLEGKWFRPNEK